MKIDTMSREYREAFREWSKLHKYRYNEGVMGKKYIAAYRKLNEITRAK